MPWSCLFEASWVGLPYCYDVWLGALFARLCFQTQVAHNENSKWKSFRAVCAMHCALNECNDARCTNKNDSKFPRTAVMASLADGGSSSRDPSATTAHVGLRVNMKHVHACVNNEKNCGEYHRAYKFSVLQWSCIQQAMHTFFYERPIVPGNQYKFMTYHRGAWLCPWGQW